MTSSHRIGGLHQERIRKEPSSSLWLWGFAVLQVMLIVPYVTKALPWAYSEGKIPIRPLYYMLFFGTLNLGVAILKVPDFSRTGFLVLLLIAARAFDATIFERYTYPEEHKSAVYGLWAAVFMVLIIFAIVGVLRKTSSFPLLMVAFCSICCCALAIWLEWLGLFQSTIASGRYSGFVGDPNRACSVMALMLAVFLTLSRRFWTCTFMIGVTIVGIFPTLSRGGFLIIGLIVCAFVLINFRAHLMKFLLIAAGAVPALILGVGLLVAKSNEGGRQDSNAEERISAIFSGDFSKMGSSERKKDFLDGLGAALSKPLTGLGTGAGSALYQPHNQILSVWIDLGFFGALLYFVILLIAASKAISRGAVGIYLAIPILLYVPLSQALLENYAYLLGLAVWITVCSRKMLGFRLFRPQQSQAPAPERRAYA